MTNLTVGDNARAPQIMTITKTITFTGGAGAGAIGQVPVFSFSGLVHCVKLIPYCTVDLVSSGGTISLGHSLTVNALIAVTTASTVDAGMYWLTATPNNKFITIPALLFNAIYKASMTIDVLTADVTAGTLVFYMEYYPIVPGAVVT